MSFGNRGRDQLISEYIWVAAGSKYSWKKIQVDRELNLVEEVMTFFLYKEIQEALSKRGKKGSHVAVGEKKRQREE